MDFSKITYEAQGSFIISADGPVIIGGKSESRINPEVADTVFLSGLDGTSNKAYVIPGSSIKGVISSYIYNLCNGNKTIIESIFGKVDTYNGSFIKSKVSFSDSYADMSTVETTIRANTAIDSVGQSAKDKSLNNIEAVIKGDFKCGFKMKNITSKELEYVMQAISAFNTGELCIGGRISRGFGRVKVKNFLLSVTNGYNIDLAPQIIETFDSPEKVIESVYNGKLKKCMEGQVRA